MFDSRNGETDADIGTRLPGPHRPRNPSLRSTFWPNPSVLEARPENLSLLLAQTVLLQAVEECLVGQVEQAGGLGSVAGGVVESLGEAGALVGVPGNA